MVTYEHHLQSSLTIVIYDPNMFIVQATGESHCAECRFVERRSAECRGATPSRNQRSVQFGFINKKVVFHLSCGALSKISNYIAIDIYFSKSVSIRCLWLALVNGIFTFLYTRSE